MAWAMAEAQDARLAQQHLEVARRDDAAALDNIALAISDLASIWPPTEADSEAYDAAAENLTGGVEALQSPPQPTIRSAALDHAVTRALSDRSGTGLHDVTKTAAERYITNRVAEGSHISNDAASRDIVDFVGKIKVGFGGLFLTRAGAFGEFARVLKPDPQAQNISTKEEAYRSAVASQLREARLKALARTGAKLGLAAVAFSFAGRRFSQRD